MCLISRLRRAAAFSGQFLLKVEEEKHAHSSFSRQTPQNSRSASSTDELQRIMILKSRAGLVAATHTLWIYCKAASTQDSRCLFKTSMCCFQTYYRASHYSHIICFHAIRVETVARYCEKKACIGVLFASNYRWSCLADLTPVKSIP